MNTVERKGQSCKIIFELTSMPWTKQLNKQQISNSFFLIKKVEQLELKVFNHQFQAVDEDDKKSKIKECYSNYLTSNVDSIRSLYFIAPPPLVKQETLFYNYYM